MVKKLLKLSMRQIWTGTKEVAMGLEKRQKRVICSAHCKMERGGAACSRRKCHERYTHSFCPFFHSPPTSNSSHVVLVLFAI